MKIISKDLRDGEKLPERHVFNGMGYQGDNISPHLAWDEVPAGTKILWSPVTTRMHRQAQAGGTGLWRTCPPTHAYCHRVPAQAWLLCLKARFRPVPILVKRVTVAQRRQKGKPTAISSRCMRWMWTRLRWMKGRAARWWALTCISIRWAARRLRRCIHKKSRVAATPYPAWISHS